MHLDFYDAAALAGFAAPTFDIETKPTWLIAARLGFGQARIPIPDGREGPRIGGGVRARGAANRALINVDDFIEVL